MKRVISFLFPVLSLISCSQRNNENQVTDALPASKSAETRDTVVASSDDDSDCIFNNDYKQLTQDWLKELKIKDFIWREDLKQAMIPAGQDTVFISRGGCTHSGISVELKLTNNNHALNDSAFWIQKALDLAKNYEMSHYEQALTNGYFNKGGGGEKNVWYEIEDDDIEDNLIYLGIEIRYEGQNTWLTMSQYFN